MQSATGDLSAEQNACIFFSHLSFLNLILYNLGWTRIAVKAFIHFSFQTRFPVQCK